MGIQAPEGSGAGGADVTKQAQTSADKGNRVTFIGILFGFCWNGKCSKAGCE